MNDGAKIKISTIKKTDKVKEDKKSMLNNFALNKKSEISTNSTTSIK